jgi:hypothetical protein
MKLSECFPGNGPKMRELILLIARESEGDAPFGATKLNKLLFYIDFLAYSRFGQAVTDHEYQKLPAGPAPRQMLPLLNEMESRGDCAIVEREYFTKTIRRTVALREPQLSLFSANEIDLVHTIIRQFWGKDAREMTDTSHKFIGWKLAGNKETIPYSVVLVRRGHRSNQAEQIAISLRAKAQDCLARER